MKKNKEHKKGESTIGKIIYGFLLFMPLFAIGVTCCYAIFNKNAYQSYSGTNTTDYTLINVENFTLNEKYLYNGTSTGDNLINPAPQDLFVNNFELKTLTNSSDYQWVDTHNIKTIRFNNSSNTNIYIRFIDNENNYRDVNNKTNSISFVFNYESGNITDNYVKSLFKQYEYNNNYYVDNVFYYSVDKVTENPLFSWATNSVIYNTMNATCTQLSITAPFIPLLLSYWLIISVIYFLYDIALMLIWLLHDKIHEMRDSLA